MVVHTSMTHILAKNLSGSVQLQKSRSLPWYLKRRGGIFILEWAKRHCILTGSFCTERSAAQTQDYLHRRPRVRISWGRRFRS